MEKKIKKTRIINTILCVKWCFFFKKLRTTFCKITTYLKENRFNFNTLYEKSSINNFRRLGTWEKR